MKESSGSRDPRLAVGGPPADLTVPAALASRATADPEGTFLIHGDEAVTFGQMETRAEALAASLHGLGIERGDRVALAMPSWPEFVIAMFAVAKLGAVVVPLNPRLTADDLRYTLRHSGAVAAITAETVGDLDFLHLFEELLVQLPELQYLVTVGDEDLWYDDRVFQFEDLLSAGGGRDYSANSPPSADEVFAIVYTAGTTGKPKGVELTHANLLQVAGSTVEALELTRDDRVVGITALFHVFGLGPGILGPGGPFCRGQRSSFRMNLDRPEPWTSWSATARRSIMGCRRCSSPNSGSRRGSQEISALYVAAWSRERPYRTIS